MFVHKSEKVVVQKAARTTWLASTKVLVMDHDVISAVRGLAISCLSAVVAVLRLTEPSRERSLYCICDPDIWIQ